ncbi:MAG: hypothetical protein AAFY03_07860 [Pseudomonadota bacterium]
MTNEVLPETLAALDIEIEISNSLWAEEISTAATWPSEEAFESVDKFHARMEKFDEFLVGPESRQISRILFQLKAFAIDTVEAMENLISRHNENIEDDLADPDYVRASGINPERLRQAIFSSESEKDVLLNNVARFGAGVLHKSAYGRLLVRHANVNRVNTTLDILRDAGFVSVRKGANNADIVTSDGRLEAAHESFLRRIQSAAEGGTA